MVALGSERLTEPENPSRIGCEPPVEVLSVAFAVVLVGWYDEGREQRRGRQTHVNFGNPGL